MRDRRNTQRRRYHRQCGPTRYATPTTGNGEDPTTLGTPGTNPTHRINATYLGTRYPADYIDANRHLLRWPPAFTIDDHLDFKGTLHVPLAAGRVTFLRHVDEHQTINIAGVNWTTGDTIPIGGLVTAKDEHPNQMQEELLTAVIWALLTDGVSPQVLRATFEHAMMTAEPITTDLDIMRMDEAEDETVN